MNLKQLLRSIREAKFDSGPKGNKKSLSDAYGRVHQAAREQLRGEGNDKKKISNKEAKAFIAQPGPARTST